MEQTIHKRVEVDGNWVSIDLHGDPATPPLLVIPGVLADAAAWAPVAADLSRTQTVAVLNRRGRAPSGPLTPAYCLQTELEDASAALRALPPGGTIFGWSFGGLIALHLANQHPFDQVIAYEPIARPFGATALPHLRQAHQADDTDTVLEVALREVTGAGEDMVTALRADPSTWQELRRLSAPLYNETRAINEADLPPVLAAQAAQVDLIIGSLNRGRPPYGTSFDTVAARVPHASIHTLDGQGHLAHLQAPAQLAARVAALLRPQAP